MFDVVTTTFEYGNNTVEIETGEIARQAHAAVKVDMGGTVVFVSVVGRKEAKPGQSYKGWCHQLETYVRTVSHAGHNLV